MYRRQRQLRRADIDYLVKIDQDCFEKPWRLEHWEQALRTDSVMVATFWGTPVGYILWRGDTVVRFAVKRNHRRKGLATNLFNALKQKGLSEINALVPEGRLYADGCAVAKFLMFNVFIARAPIENETVRFIWRSNVFPRRTEPDCSGR